MPAMLPQRVAQYMRLIEKILAHPYQREKRLVF